ncbi:ribonuclease T2 [Rhizobium sp. Root274]|uniref:ribonuclease T2 family protein n=1 Tax=unclassified Rhizobium TaxID=2613769 RepID=UPI0007132193|nr:MULTISPECIES: ribonuclease T(2) [unclassified Rhizobium]KQW30968.1 ribonuclease T2 [Rhizobium sp. Root1240]KRD32513.1 ribonuclease T2 [Rhizobium sp. Root274]
MGRYSGFFAFGLLLVAAAFYSFLPSKRVESPSVTTTSPQLDQTPSQSGNKPQFPNEPSEVQGGRGFDFYVLSLSWSPTYCDSEAGRGNRVQCGTGKRFGWVVHGLWPQNERGYPQDCDSSDGSRVPDSIARGIMDIMPGMGLIGHQWRKHGSCSGLSMADYFALVRKAHDKILIPPQFSSVRQPLQTSPAALEQAFIRSNPGLTASAVAITCDSQRVDEVRICLDTSLNFRACREVDQRSCKRSDLTIPPQP